MSTSFRFEHRWLLDAEAGAAYDVLVDVERYPEWWPQISAVAKLGEDHALVLCRSVLPFTLHLELRPVVRDPDAGVLHVSIDGDLEGWSRFTLSPTDAGLDVFYEQEVETRRPMLDATRWVRRAVRTNHTWMMRSARVGLETRVALASR
ncbi:MAG TPA: SRPBCC family protein [Nocardioidaceae bacterium]|nr:SRPBCC family protein [Nocardioidaceae bacterium]